jgi:hypothetical protein
MMNGQFTIWRDERKSMQMNSNGKRTVHHLERWKTVNGYLFITFSFGKKVPYLILR